MNIEIAPTEFKPAKDVVIPGVFYKRITTGIPAVDSFLSGGWLPGSTFTFTGRAGLGKSTFLFQMLEATTKQGYSVCVAGCEESIYQMAFTCNRLGVQDVMLGNKSDVDEIVALMPLFDILIIDSFPGLTTKHGLNTRAHEKYCYETIVSKAQEHECTTGFVCHLTKQGILKGSSDLLHVVDANMRIVGPEAGESDECRHIMFDKNRFGAAGELTGTMTSKGYVFDTEPLVNPTITVQKHSTRNKLWTEVLKIEGEITLQKVMPLVNGNVAAAMTLLREMVLNEMVTKSGRGNTAQYERISN